MWNFLQWKLVLGGNAPSLFYAVLKSWVSMINLSGTSLKNYANLLWNSFFFCIWLARNNKKWTLSVANCKLDDSSKETYNSPCSMSSLKQTSVKLKVNSTCRFHQQG